MRKLLTLTVLVLTVFSTPVFAEWTEVDENFDGDTFYVDFERIRKHGGYVYYWELGDYLKPNKQGNLSGKRYNQGDCNLFRFSVLSYIFHQQPMGRDVGDTEEPVNKEWRYPSPNSVNEIILKSVCAYAK